MATENYIRLIMAFPLRHLQNEAELARAISVLDSLIVRDLDEAEQDYLDVLTDLVEKYEKEHIPISRAT